MEKDKKFRALAIAAICVAVVGVSVAYAALQASLTIEGTATVDTGSSWNIGWLSVTNPLQPTEGDSVTRTDSSIGFGENNIGVPTISGNKVSFTAVFTAPNTSFTFKAVIRNQGTLNGQLLGETGTASYVTVSGGNEDKFEISITRNGADIDTKAGSILLGKTNTTPTDAEIVVTVRLKDMSTEEFNALVTDATTFTLTLPFEQAADGVVSPTF